jgi:hypothetical protein
MKTLAYVWRILMTLLYWGIVVEIFSVATTRFETLVFAMLVELYSVALLTFCQIGTNTELTDYAAFVRFKMLATALGIKEIEDRTFQEEEKTLEKKMTTNAISSLITMITHGVVSFYAFFKIVQAVFFA